MRWPCDYHDWRWHCDYPIIDLVECGVNLFVHILLIYKLKVNFMHRLLSNVPFLSFSIMSLMSNICYFIWNQFYSLWLFWNVDFGFWCLIYVPCILLICVREVTLLFLKLYLNLHWAHDDNAPAFNFANG